MQKIHAIWDQKKAFDFDQKIKLEAKLPILLVHCDSGEKEITYQGCTHFSFVPYSNTMEMFTPVCCQKTAKIHQNKYTPRVYIKIKEPSLCKQSGLSQTKDSLNPKS